MRFNPHRVLLFTALLLCGPASWAQMHKVAKPEQVVRAVGVYEWTGDFAKPNASRLIPVSLFIDGKLEDAGIYVARPVPFALLSGNVYELQTAGIDKGYLDLAYAKHLQAVEATGDLAYDDGWFGYGSVKPLAAPKKAAALKPSKTLPVLTGSKGDTSHHTDAKTNTDSTTTSDDPNRPTMKRRSDSSTTDTSSSSTPTSTTSTTSTDDPDRPTMKRRSDSADSSTTDTSTASTGSTPADDPDRPTMKRRSDSTDASATTSTTSNTPADDPDRPTMSRRTSGTSDTTTADTGSTTASTSTPSDDPDRPTLKRHSAEDARRAHDTNSVIGTGSLNDDPNRPNLHRGKPTSAMTETDLPKLVGIPQNLHQMVAVSDAATRDPHAFTLEWEDAAQHAAILSKMQAMAQAQLASYNAMGTKPAATPPAPTVKKTPTTTRTRRATSAAPPSVLLSDEELKAYTLSYGGAATYVYSAHTAGTGAALRYVTIVAQDNGLGELRPAIQSVTDAAHLDRTPLMRFVDVVDAEASNRASLLFELRSQNARQFGLYRVIASHSEQIFLTGTTQ
ncbi:hypothetical protein [Tunturibacter empetritectus]|uniref:Uncharacterized protein n=1 Tax=Tunturiibacter empetritectus TaxID=3069691 RepID=A0A7W8MTX0_9BACT|nr:hypothetical protein [Edaphobacter lichenicola]MBB5318659.1 hypothetical protein [Edaphobacter lichenicola]